MDELDILKQTLSTIINDNTQNNIYNNNNDNIQIQNIQKEIKKELLTIHNIQIPVRCYSFSFLDNYEEKYKHLEDKECVILSNIKNIHYINNNEYIQLKINYNDNVEIFLTEIDNIDKYILTIEDNINDLENCIFIPNKILNKLWLNQGEEIYISNINYNDIENIQEIILSINNEIINKQEFIDNIKEKYNNKLITLNHNFLNIDNNYISIIDINPKNDKYLLFNKDKTNIILKEKID